MEFLIIEKEKEREMEKYFNSLYENFYKEISTLLQYNLF